MTADQAGQFLRAAEGTTWEVLFHFAFTTGMRPEEYLALFWSDVDLVTGTVRVERVLVRSRKRAELRPEGDAGWSFEKPKTASSVRSLIIPASMVARLKLHKARQNEERVAVGEGYRDYGLVFADSLGEPLNGCNLLRRHLKPLLAKAGLPKEFNLYSARHAAATALLKDRESLKVVSELLGHSTIRLTGDVYSHVTDDMLEEASAKLGKRMFR